MDDSTDVSTTLRDARGHNSLWHTHTARPPVHFQPTCQHQVQAVQLGRVGQQAVKQLVAEPKVAVQHEAPQARQHRRARR